MFGFRKNTFRDFPEDLFFWGVFVSLDWERSRVSPSQKVAAQSSPISPALFVQEK